MPDHLSKPSSPPKFRNHYGIHIGYKKSLMSNFSKLDSVLGNGAVASACYLAEAEGILPMRFSGNSWNSRSQIFGRSSACLGSEDCRTLTVATKCVTKKWPSGPCPITLGGKVGASPPHKPQPASSVAAISAANSASRLSAWAAAAALSPRACFSASSRLRATFTITGICTSGCNST